MSKHGPQKTPLTNLKKQEQWGTNENTSVSGWKWKLASRLIEEAYIYIYIGEGHWDFWLGGFAQSFVLVCCAVCRFSPLFSL